MREASTLMAVAGPIILSQLGSVGMHTMDTLMVGPLGASSLAAAAIASDWLSVGRGKGNVSKQVVGV